jgi:hypothetical protein
MQHFHQPHERQPHGARVTPTMRATALACAVVAFAGCRISDGGLSGAVSTMADGSTSPSLPPAPARADGSAADVIAAPPDAVILAPDVAGTDASLPPPPSTPPPAPPATDAATPTDAPPVLPDAGPVDVVAPPPTPPVSADPCGPPAGGLLAASVRVRGEGPAQDFTFANSGLLILAADGNVLGIDNNGRAETLVRNLVFRGGRLRGLTDGDLLVLDSSRNQLSRLDPELRRPERFPMYVRQPLQLAPMGGSNSSLFFVTNEQGQIFRANANNGDLTLLIDVGNVTFGGLAADPTRRKLYVGVMGNGGAIHAFDIGTNGQLSGLTRVADNTPSPTALALDSCGGLYIGGGAAGVIRRRSPTGTVSAVARVDARDIVTLELGPGRQGWSDQSLFGLDSETGTLFEIRLRN